MGVAADGRVGTARSARDRRPVDAPRAAGFGRGAIAVDEAEIETAAAELRTTEGIDAGPEAGAGLAALQMLTARGDIRPDDVVVLFNTGANKYR